MKAKIKILVLLVSVAGLSACAEKEFDSEPYNLTPASSDSVDSGSSGSVMNPPASSNTGTGLGTGAAPGTGTGSAAPNNPQVRIEQFVRELYENTFQRRQETAGYLYWVAEYRRGGIGCKNLTLNFLRSQENAPVRNNANLNERYRSEYIQLAYMVVLNRDADQPGYDYWLKEMNRGYTVANLEDVFVDSPEFRARCQAYGLRY